jgi:hypothetical protein
VVFPRSRNLAAAKSSGLGGVRSVFLEVRSLHRKVRLELGEGDGYQMLLVPIGSTDKQVLAWAAEVLPARVVNQLQNVLAEEERRAKE